MGIASIPDALVFFEYEDTANCKFFLLGPYEDVTMKSHRALAALAACTLASRDALESKDLDLHIEATRLWDKMDVEDSICELGGRIHDLDKLTLYKLRMFE